MTYANEESRKTECPDTKEFMKVLVNVVFSVIYRFK